MSRSIFIQITNKGVTVDRLLVEKLQREMRNIVEADLPFNRTKITIEEAEKLYEELGYKDKLEILKYRPERLYIYMNVMAMKTICMDIWFLLQVI